jgi:hypothetical protein
MEYHPTAIFLTFYVGKTAYCQLLTANFFKMGFPAGSSVAGLSAHATRQKLLFHETSGTPGNKWNRWNSNNS